MSPPQPTTPSRRAPTPSVRPPGRPLGSIVTVVLVVIFHIVAVILFVVNLYHNDPTVVEAGDGLCLALEPLLWVRISDDVFREDFDRDVAVQIVGASLAGLTIAMPPRISSRRATCGTPKTSTVRERALGGSHGLVATARSRRPLTRYRPILAVRRPASTNRTRHPEMPSSGAPFLLR